ncbi:sugar ABC transporter permease [Microbacterium laevaniformans]|uniref:Lactose transport system permease protein LacF n=2 Tax=Microbacterium TaxID=33882 RepID=A0A150HHV7_9MICO|nr:MULTISPECIES: sugar ABC transporter permease [Microbacterium]MDC7804128.1 sugar ABC transporter permease [Sphingomonas sp. BLCC-B65]AXA96625.1 sugar ABC transporter permease [Microbacterium sp. PM5]KIC58691.1 ABC transporter permease [Microbacterium hominis]KXZ61709.1 Lactose transport system permease protein LacF [Microbacterium laevaniformans]TGY38350.1 sugar ABC transporter permease [Microbacterium laevaniformans]
MDTTRTSTRVRGTAAIAARQPKRIGFGSRLSSWDLKLSPYLYISPFFILFLVVGLFPIGYTAVISFMDWDLVRNSGTFVGFDQYATVISDPKFWAALRNTFSIFLLSSVPQLIAAVFIAALLDQNIRAKTFWRMGVLVPYVMAPVAVALIFSNMFGDQYGIINTWLSSIGLPPVMWHSDTFASHIAIATMVNFRWTGYNTLILLAAMQAIPRDYYEAATVDGAGKVRQFFAITLPSLRPTLIFVIITSTIGGLQIFDEPRMYDQTGTGGANNQWLTISLWLYDLGWGQWNLGRAAALAWILFIIILVIGVINLFITRNLVRDEGSRNTLTRAQMRAARRAARAAVAADRAAASEPRRTNESAEVTR